MIRIGISGWRYDPWRGVFYPEGMPQRRELEFCGRHFPTVEINGSFYSLQRPEYYEQWYRETPEGFLFAVKGSRYITHMLRLSKIEKPLANFFASGILNLRDKLGPFLWQFPPMFQYKPERLERFFDLLPRTSEAALSLARKRDARMIGRSRLAIDANRPIRHAVEVRHPSFMTSEFVRLLRQHDIGLVVQIPPASGRRCFMSLPTSCTCACTATSRSTPAAIPTRRSTAGRAASVPGTATGETCMCTSTTTSR